MEYQCHFSLSILFAGGIPKQTHLMKDSSEKKKKNDVFYTCMVILSFDIDVSFPFCISKKEDNVSHDEKTYKVRPIRHLEQIKFEAQASLQKLLLFWFDVAGNMAVYLFYLKWHTLFL